jgi:hypothetical protein
LTEVHGREGVVLTAAHVVEDRKGPITVEFFDGQISGARLLAIDPKLDVAALVIYAPRGIEPVPVATANPELGQKVEIWGYGPKKFRSFAALVSRPIVLTGDAPETLIGARGVDKGEVTIPGDSGGPMIQDGKLVGVHWGYRGAAADPRRCVHALGCRSIGGWLRSRLTRWSSRSAGSNVANRGE